MSIIKRREKKLRQKQIDEKKIKNIFYLKISLQFSITPQTSKNRIVFLFCFIVHFFKSDDYF